ncbi:28S ribosomal protein S31, mitochondrial isoform X2 [Eublepharis macularius]|uniref:Small ribosomal subunit protein mS31 n=1 Tax=Eublepharis macularius TaxID=481883 RepID=A0AA97LFA4_EUBMA|nr:28S ribosomal protein S31, mitochondrial isoform X2 [Eublepharis macularius]
MWRGSVFGAESFRACLRARRGGLVAQDRVQGYYLATLAFKVSQLACSSKQCKSFGISAVFWTSEDERHTPVNDIDEKTDERNKREAMEATAKKNLLNVLSEMKVEVSSKKTFQKLKAQKMKDKKKDLPEHLESTSSMFQKAAEDKAKSKQLGPELVAAASAVASSLPFDRKSTISELLQLLKKQKDVTEERRRGEATNISKIVTNMKIGKKPPTRDAFRASNQIQFDDDGRGYMIEKAFSREPSNLKRRGLYLSKRLNIFPAPPPATEKSLETVTEPTIWDVELAKEIAAVGQRPPRNGFEEMIEWTKEGKLWEFPIDNEAGFEDDVEFHEHIFLDKHLADFPKEGPIRHFMELVTCGLSKNSYLSVKEKVEYIDWFRNYFKEKEELLKEIEAHEKEAVLEREKLSK